jgi:hypothetical protein
VLAVPPLDTGNRAGPPKRPEPNSEGPPPPIPPGGLPNGWLGCYEGKHPKVCYMKGLLYEAVGFKAAVPNKGAKF